MLRHRWYKKLLIPLLLAAVLPYGCKQKEKKTADPKVPEYSYTSETALVSEGNSSQAVFSPKGDRLLFVSGKRPGHAQAQVYEKNLETGEETRITFQNGDTSRPRYHPKEEAILYSSSTDELKENPPLLRPSTAASILPAQFQDPTEVYLHSLNGLEITRLSNTPGFDGEARFSTDGKIIYWTRARGNKVESVSMNRSSHATQVIQKLGVNPAGYTISPDGKWKAWIDWDETFGVARLKFQKGKDQPAEINSDLIVPKADAEFSPDSKWLFWSQLNTESRTWQLWIIELENACAHKISDNKDGDRRHAALSPDMRRLVYTATGKAKPGEPYVQSRIMQVGFLPPSGPCAGSP